MVGTTLKMRMDENAIEKHNQVQTKKLVASTNEAVTKRAALGDLQNRGVLRAQGAKDVAQKDIKDVKLQNALRNTKARVDTHWKKAPLTAANNAAASKKITTTTATTGTTADNQRRMLLRSNSMRSGTNPSGLTLQRQASANVLPLSKTTTTNAKVVESKPAVAVANVEKPKQKLSESESSEGSTGTALRREDSNLSRKSLTKLRAALTAKPVVSKTQAITVAKKDSLTKIKIPPVAKILPVQKVAESTNFFRRLEGIEDIDADDKENLVLVAEYVNDIYDYLYSVEEAQSIRKDHLNGQLEVHAKMRSVLIDWINEVHIQFHLAAETFYMAVGIIDLYLQTVKDTKRLHLQLVGVTALFIATKYEELFPPAISDFVYITDDTYTARQIRLMELQILKALDFTLSRPLPIHFLRRYSKAAGAEDAHHAMSKYFLELSSIEYDLASYKPSEIAAASLFLSLHLLNGKAKAGTGFNNKHWNKTLEYYSRYSAEHLRPITKKIATIARNAPQAKLKAVYNKYKLEKFQEVALRSELCGPLMDSIVNSSE